MFTKIVMLFAVATAVLLQGCGEKPFPQDRKVDGIVRILMHEPGRYTVLVQRSVSEITELQVDRGRCRSMDVLYTPDVTPHSLMWFEEVHSGRTEANLCLNKHLNFHIHTAEDIGGAGWNHGKFGHGQTVVVR